MVRRYNAEIRAAQQAGDQAALDRLLGRPSNPAQWKVLIRDGDLVLDPTDEDIAASRAAAQQRQEQHHRNARALDDFVFGTLTQPPAAPAAADAGAGPSAPGRV